MALVDPGDEAPIFTPTCGGNFYASGRSAVRLVTCVSMPPTVGWDRPESADEAFGRHSQSFVDVPLFGGR